MYVYKNAVVPKAGLEPAHLLRRGILNPLRLPFRHLGTEEHLACHFRRGKPKTAHISALFTEHRLWRFIRLTPDTLNGLSHQH